MNVFIALKGSHFWFLFEKLLQNVIFTCTYNGAEKHVTCERFENAASRANTNVIATVHITDDGVSFYDGPGMLIRHNRKAMH